MIKKFLQEGFVLKSKGYYKHAIEAFYKALELDDSGYEIYLEIAELYYLLGNEERSLNYIEQILEKAPTHIESMRLLKRIFLNKSAWQNAERTARNIYQITNDADDLAEILYLMNKQSRFDDVLLAEADFDNKNILYELAYASLFKKDLENALAFIEKALEMENSDKFLLLKSKILFKKNSINESAKILDLIKYDEEDADYLNFAGLVKQYDYSLNEALNYFKQALKIAPNNHEYCYNLASTYFKKGEVSSAKKYYNLAISLAPENPNYHFALANLYYAEKQYKRAFEELKYDFYESNLLKAIILYDTGYLALARKILSKLENERPEDTILLDYKKRIENDLKI